MRVEVSDFENTVEGFENFTRQAERVIKNGQSRNLQGKVIYYIDGAEKPKKGVVVIVVDGKIQSMMPSDPKSFQKMSCRDLEQSAKRVKLLSIMPWAISWIWATLSAQSSCQTRAYTTTLNMCLQVSFSRANTPMTTRTSLRS